MAVYWATPEDVCTDGWWIWSIFFGGVEKTWEVWESRMEKWNAQETEVELLEDNGFHDFLTERRHFFLVSISRRAVECCGQLWAGFLVTDKFMIFMMHWVCDKFVGPNSTGFFIIFPWALEVGWLRRSLWMNRWRNWSWCPLAIQRQLGDDGQELLKLVPSNEFLIEKTRHLTPPHM